ncbi:MAG: VTT domain-containing protein [Candidatus Beckwithbacteria bacterium]|nr:VTT domain-containing protein [Candidatus Beckwithbacteria bacterium]
MILQSKPFKIFTLILGVIFIILAFVVVFDPRPFIKFGYPGIFVYNLFGPGIFLIPVLSRHFNVFWVAFFTALGMGINDCFSWLAGKNGDIVIKRGPRIKKIEAKIRRFGPWAIFFWALIPFPFDLIAVIAGYLEVPFLRFFIPMFLGRFIRFLLLGSGIVAIWGKARPVAY